MSTEGVKNGPHRFCYLKYYVTVIYVRFVKITIFCGKTQKFKIAEFFSAIYPCI